MNLPHFAASGLSGLLQTDGNTAHAMGTLVKLPLGGRQPEISRPRSKELEEVSALPLRHGATANTWAVTGASSLPLHGHVRRTSELTCKNNHFQLAAITVETSFCLLFPLAFLPLCFLKWEIIQ